MEKELCKKFSKYQMSEYEVCGYIILKFRKTSITRFRSSHPEVFLGRSVLKICSKFIGEHPCRSAISIKLQSNFIEITLRHGCSPVNLLHIFRKPFPKNTSVGLLLKVTNMSSCFIYCYHSWYHLILRNKIFSDYNYVGPT